MALSETGVAFGLVNAKLLPVYIGASLAAGAIIVLPTIATGVITKIMADKYFLARRQKIKDAQTGGKVVEFPA
ncbi:hypothetical protein [Magnetospira sp. QH-2]|uniref:hypothetical protein n=1 Tax=Magnetospira sp. (strain QH-2) TaxID=1288970 RepID=UPI0005FA6D35|nr:hypothetical protein [Magnetospira sp. QH-2]